MPDLSVLEVNGVAYDLRDPTKAPAGYGLGSSARNIDEDLNGVVTNGWYCYNSNTCSNIPENKASLLFVESFYNTNYCKQTVTIISSGKIYTRTRNNGNWSNWSQLAYTSYAEAVGVPVVYMTAFGYENLAVTADNIDEATMQGIYYTEMDNWVQTIVFNAGFGAMQFQFNWDGGMRCRMQWGGNWKPWQSL